MFKSDRILSVNVGASQLIVAEFKALKTGGLELLNYGIGKLGVQPDAEGEASSYIVATLGDVMRDRNIRPGPALLSISGQVVFPRYVKLPPVAPDKIGQIVRYEAQQNVPFPIEEVVWDYQLIGEGSGELSVLIVAVKRDIVKSFTDCIEAVGLEPQIVDVSTMAIYNAVRYNYSDLQGCTMILDMGARTTNVIFVEGRRIFSRSIPVAGNAITRELMKEFNLPYEDAEQMKLAHAYVGFGSSYDETDRGVAERVSKIVRGTMTRLHAEVGRTINFYRSQQGGTQPSLVLLAGGSSIIPHTDTFLRDKLRVDVDYLNPFRNVAVSERISAAEISKALPLMGEVVGLALRRTLSCPVEVNLMPPDIVARHVFQRRVPFFGLAIAGLVLAIMVWWLYFGRQMGIVRQRLDRVKAEVATLSAVDARMADVKKQQAAVDGKAAQLLRLVGRRTLWHEMMEDVHGHMLEGVWLTSVRLVSKAGSGSGDQAVAAPEQAAVPKATHLEICGVGFDDKVTQTAISGFASSLKEGRHFSDRIEIRKIKPVDGTDYMTEFVIEIGLKEPVEL